VTASGLVEAVRPAFLTFPSFAVTLGPEVADLCDVVGFGPDVDQRMLLDLIFAVDPMGRSAAFEVGVCGPRQNFKTGLFKQAVIGWLFVTDQRLVVWSAHEFSTTQEAFRDLDEIVTGSDVLRRRVKAIHRGNGDEAIELVDDRRVKFKARTQGGGRGLTADKDVLDESMFLLPAHMGALLPTLSARPDPQVLYGGSAGLAKSDVWRAVRDRGRIGSAPRLVWAEYCDDLPGDCEQTACTHELAAQGCRLDDEVRWARANLALGRRITVEHIRAERKAMPPNEFGRERLGWWDDPESAAAKPISTELWAKMAVTIEPPDGPRRFFLDCSPGLSSGSIGVAVDRAGVPHVELADYRPRTEWMPARAAELHARYPDSRFGVFAGGAVMALAEDFADAGVELRMFTGHEMGLACAHLQRLVVGGGMTHSADPLFTQALEGAVARDLGDDLWIWSRRKSADISPIVAATGVAWLLEVEPAYDVLDSVH